MKKKSTVPKEFSANVPKTVSKSTYEINFTIYQTRILLVIIILLLITLLFRKKYNVIIEKIIVFSVLFLLILLITKKLIITFILTMIIFLLIDLLIKYRTTIESFQDKESDKSSDENEDDKIKKSKEGILNLLTKINGGIELKDEDLNESSPLNINLDKYNDDNKPNALKIAQKETYELINTVNALKDTITTLSPVLQEGKKLMDMFENIKL